MDNQNKNRNTLVLALLLSVLVIAIIVVFIIIIRGVVASKQDTTTTVSADVDDDKTTEEATGATEETEKTTEETEKTTEETEKTAEDNTEDTTEEVTGPEGAPEEETPGQKTPASSTGYYKTSPFDYSFYVPADFELMVSGTYGDVIKGYSYYMTNDDLGMNIYIEEIDKGAHDGLDEDYSHNVSVFGDTNFYTLDYEYSDEVTYVLSGTNVIAGDIYYYKYKDLGDKCCRIELYYKNDQKETCDEIVSDFLSKVDYDTTD